MKQVEPFLNLNLDLNLPGCGLARGAARLGRRGWAGEKRDHFEHPEK